MKVPDMTSDTEVERGLQTVMASAYESDAAHARSSEGSSAAGVVACFPRRVQAIDLPS